MAVLDRAKKTVQGQLASIRGEDYFPRQVVGRARGALDEVPQSGLPQDLAKVRRQVASGVAGLERMIGEAEAAYTRAVRSLDAIPNPDDMQAVDRTGKALMATQAVTHVQLGACLLDWWTAGLLMRYRAMRGGGAPESGGGGG